LMALFCQYCGVELPLYVQGCTRCGRRQPPASDIWASVNMQPLPATPNRLQGVGGWLMFFCIILIFLNPLGHALIAIRAFRGLAAKGAPVTIVGVISIGVTHIGLAIFSVIAGSLLWLEKRSGVSVAKMYLLVATAAIISLDIALRFRGVHLDLVRSTLERFAYAALWYAYLVNSKRVKLTYGTNLNSYGKV
jgi:hypothetical protein